MEKVGGGGTGGVVIKKCGRRPFILKKNGRRINLMRWEKEKEERLGHPGGVTSLGGLRRGKRKRGGGRPQEAKGVRGVRVGWASFGEVTAVVIVEKGKGEEDTEWKTNYCCKRSTVVLGARRGGGRGNWRGKRKKNGPGGRIGGNKGERGKKR